MQAMRNFFIDRLSVNHRFHRFHSHTTFNEAPVVLFRIFFDRVVTVTETLSVTTVSALEHVEIQPGGIIEPGCRSRSAAWMESHQVIFVDCLDRGRQCFPFGCLYVTTNITADKPDNVRLVFITFCKELAIGFRLFYIHFATVHRASPYTNHTDVHTFSCSRTDDIIHMIPITIYTFLIDVFEIISVYH